MIIKVGVVPLDDAKYLAIDYGVQVRGTLDLRHITRYNGWKSDGLAKLAKTYLNVELDKNWRIRCSDWEHPCLTQNQIKYAATDAHIAILLYRLFLGHRFSLYIKLIILFRKIRFF